MARELTAKNILRFGSIILLFLVISGYGIWRSRDLLFGIKITTSGITDGMTETNSVLDFYGNVRHANGLTINSMIVPLAQNGTWHDILALLPGENVITITARDKFNRTISKQFHVYYQQ